METVNGENVGVGLRDALVVVHAPEALLANFDDALSFAMGMRQRIEDYLSEQKSVIYAAFSEKSQEEMPTALFGDKERVGFVPPLGEAFGEHVFFDLENQSKRIRELLSASSADRGSDPRRVEVIGLGRHACSRVICKNLNGGEGYAAEVNESLCRNIDLKKLRGS